MTDILDYDHEDRGEAFGALVKKAISYSERHNITSVAAAMGMTYQAFYQRLDGRTAFSADEIRRLIACFPDASIVSYLLRGTAFIAADRVDPDRSHEEEKIYKAVHRTVLEASDVLRVVDIALRDGKIDHREAITITEQIEEAERSLVSLREYIASLK